jgi:DDE superfamily endonuclease
MLQRALDADVPATWVTADEAYGGDPALRRFLEARGLSYVLAVKCTEPLRPADGSARATAVERQENVSGHASGMSVEPSVAAGHVSDLLTRPGFGPGWGSGGAHRGSLPRVGRWPPAGLGPTRWSARFYDGGEKEIIIGGGLPSATMKTRGMTQPASDR